MDRYPETADGVHGEQAFDLASEAEARYRLTPRGEDALAAHGAARFRGFGPCAAAAQPLTVNLRT